MIMETLADDHQKYSSFSITNVQPGKDTVKPVADKDLQPEIQNEADSINNIWDYEEILKILGFGKTQWILFLVGGLLTTSTAVAQQVTAIIVISSQCEFDMTQNERGVMMAAFVAGRIVSAYILGFISDVWGRKPILVWTTLIATFLQFVSMFVANIWLFNFINFLIGISLGSTTGIKFAYIGEFCTAKYRPLVVNYTHMFFALTGIYISAVSWWVLSTDWSFHLTDAFVIKSWRFIIFFCLLPGLISGLILLPYPESPKFLLALGKHDEAVKALDWISKTNRNLSLETMLKCSSSLTVKTGETADTSLLERAKGWAMLKNAWKSAMEMFHKPHGWNILILISCFFGLMFASNGLQMWFPDVVNRSIAGAQPSTNFTLCELIRDSYRGKRLNGTDLSEGEEKSKVCDDSIATKTYIDNIIMGTAFFIGFVIQGLLLQTFSRKKLLLTVLSVGVLCGILLNFIANSTGILNLLCLFVLIPASSVSIMCGVVVDLVPTHLRGKAINLAYTLGRLGVIIATNLIGVMLEPYCSGLFVLTTCIVLVCVVLVYYLPF